MNIRTGNPTLKTFDGEPPQKGGKSQVSFEQWKQDVLNLKGNYGVTTIREAIYKSLSGSARSALSSLGEKPTLKAIIQRLEVMFGTVFSMDVLLQQFYRISQDKKETVSQFAAHLEVSMNHIVSTNVGFIHAIDTELHIKQRLFHGARENIRNAV